MCHVTVIRVICTWVLPAAAHLRAAPRLLLRVGVAVVVRPSRHHLGAVVVQRPPVAQVRVRAGRLAAAGGRAGRGPGRAGWAGGGQGFRDMAWAQRRVVGHSRVGLRFGPLCVCGGAVAKAHSPEGGIWVAVAPVAPPLLNSPSFPSPGPQTQARFSTHARTHLGHIRIRRL